MYMENNGIVQRLIESKKYSAIDKKTIENIYISKPHNEESLRAKLHQIWGAYYTTRPNFNKLSKKLELGSLNIDDIVKIHSSSKERVLEYSEILDDIFKIVGDNNTVLDIGAGLNPLFFLKRSDFKTYLSVDIDKEQQTFLQKVFDNKFLINMNAVVGDALVDSFEYYDVIFLLKVLPVLDQINPLQTDMFLNSIKCKYLVISFPNKSLGGKNKGMINNYKEKYIDRVGNAKFQMINEKQYQNETVYIFKKQNRAN